MNSNLPQKPNPSIIKLSRFLSFILRHKPEKIGLSLDKQGWADVDILIKLARQKGKKIDRFILEQIVITDDKQRFSFNENKSKIRANQGHSIAIDLALNPCKPPQYLFHGTATRFLESIFQQGLLKQQRNYVHLSSDRTTAIEVGQRHGKPIVLQIKAEQMHDRGFVFFLSENNVWLTESIPPQYIELV